MRVWARVTSLVSGEHWEQAFFSSLRPNLPISDWPPQTRHCCYWTQFRQFFLFHPLPSFLLFNWMFSPSKYFGSLILLKSYFSLTIMAPLLYEHVSGNFADLVKILSRLHHTSDRFYYWIKWILPKTNSLCLVLCPNLWSHRF